MGLEWHLLLTLTAFGHCWLSFNAKKRLEILWNIVTFHRRKKVMCPWISWSHQWFIFVYIWSNPHSTEFFKNHEKSKNTLSDKPALTFNVSSTVIDCDCIISSVPLRLTFCAFEIYHCAKLNLHLEVKCWPDARDKEL